MLTQVRCPSIRDVCCGQAVAASDEPEGAGAQGLKRREAALLDPPNTTAVSRQPNPAWSKLKPRWDVHLPGAGNRAGGLAVIFRPLIAGPSGSAASPRVSGWTARPGSG